MQKKLVQKNPKISIRADSSHLGWGAFYQGERTEVCWDRKESHFHINALEMLAVLCPKGIHEGSGGSVDPDFIRQP